MPQDAYGPPYSFDWTHSTPMLRTTNATKTHTEVASARNGNLSLASTIGVANATDFEFVGTNTQAMIGHRMEIRRIPRRRATLMARFVPMQATRSLSAQDELGISSLNYSAEMIVNCYIMVPGIGWLTPDKVELNHSDTDESTHSNGNPAIIRGGQRSVIWRLPNRIYPNGLVAWFGFLLYQRVIADDVSITASTSMVGKLANIFLNH